MGRPQADVDAVLRSACRLRVVCHEDRRSKRRYVTVREMKVGPSRPAVRFRPQTAASCCRQKAMVVSVAVNVGRISRRVRLREASASEPPMNCRKPIRRCQNRGVTLPPGSARGNPEDCPSGIRHVGGAKLNQALVRNVRTCAPMQRERSQAAQTARIRVPMRGAGAEQPVVGMKAL